MASLINKWLVLALIPVICMEKPLVLKEFHPFHVSVIEINHNSLEKTLEISCKLFTDDFEKALAGHFKTKIDLINPVDRNATSKYVNDYVQANFSMIADGKPLKYSIIGFEEEGDAVYAYFQVDQVGSVKKLEMNNTLMYTLFDDQIGIMHVVVGEKRKSTKLNYPDKKAEVNF
jgi:hypothetical protein